MPGLAKDSAGDSLDTVVLPKTTDSENSNGQPSSTTSGIDVKAIAQELAPLLIPTVTQAVLKDAQVARENQVGKDKRLKKLDNFNPEQFQLVADYIQEHQGNVQEALRAAGTDVALDRLSRMDQQAAPNAPQTKDNGMSKEEMDSRVRHILSETKLPVDDQKAIMTEWSKGTFANNQEMLDGLQSRAISYVASKSAGASTSTGGETTTTSAAGVVGAAGTPPGGDTDKASKVAGLYAQLEGLQSQGIISQSRAAREDVKKQLRELGEKV